MQEIVGESLARRLVDWGVDTVFGLPGDGINGLMEGFRRHRDRLRFVLVHHEEAAAFMATGYAKATGASASVRPPRARAPSTCSTGSTSRATRPRPPEGP